MDVDVVHCVPPRSICIPNSCSLVTNFHSLPTNWYDEITAAVVWHRQKGNQNHQRSFQTQRPNTLWLHHTVLWCKWWEQRSYGMKAPLRAIKYSSSIRHWVLGSIPIALCNKPQRKLLLKTTTHWRLYRAEQNKLLQLSPVSQWYIY